MKYFLILLIQISTLSLFSQNTNLDSLITQTQWESLFPKRAGILTGHPQGYTSDFYSFLNLKQAINDLSDFKVTIRKKIGVWGELTTITRKSTNITYNYSDVDISWYSNTTPETIIIVDFKDFINRASALNNKRELSAFLANISKETTGGWQTPVGGGSAGDYALWGLYFGFEVGYTSANSAGAYSQAHAEYPPNASKGYYGRGPIQLSWNYNYGQFSKFLFNDKNVLLNNPDTIQKDGVLAFKSAIWFWMMPQCPKPSCHQVMHDLWLPIAGEYTSNKMFKKGFAHTNNIINGGLECRITSTAAFYNKVVLRSELYKYYLGISGFNTTQIASENTGNNTTLCYESTTNAMQDYINCAVISCIPTSSIRTKIICSNKTYLYNNQNLAIAGNYKDTFVNANGCDSIETLTLIINQIKNKTINLNICQGDSIRFKNSYLKISGTYYDTLVSENNCDSIIQLNLFLKPKFQTIIAKSICQGDSVYFKNRYLKISGTYYDTLISENNCDSIIQLNLFLNPKFQTTIAKSICQGDSFYFNNQYFKISGVYQQKYKTVLGCDSIINLNLTILPLPVVNLTQSNNQLIATAGYSNYKWFFNNIALSTLGNIHQASKDGLYLVEVENTLGCKNKTDIYYTQPQLGINYTSDQQLEIYPTHTSGIVYINGLSIPRNVIVYDVLGIKRLESIVEKKLDLSSLSNGFYWVEIENKKEKIILEK